MPRQLSASGPAALKKPAEWRVIMNDDSWNQFGGGTTAEMLRRRVDYIAEAGVDVLASCTCSPDLCLYPTKVGEWLGAAERFAKPTSGGNWNLAYNLRTLVGAGTDPFDVLAERCHRHGMPFVGSIRMNDIHHAHGYYHAQEVTEFFATHQQWAIRDNTGRFVGGMDYAVPEIRRRRLAIMREQVERYDLDGLELDFMRTPPFFQPQKAEQNAPILTAYVAEIRQMLNDTARTRGRPEPILGVRVPTTPGWCRRVGIDLPVMIREGGLTYICPSHGSKPDYNTPVERFAEIVKGTDCRIFPTMQQAVAAQYDADTIMSLERYRGLGHNFFRYGAHGISTFNFMMGDIDTWHIQRHIGAWTMMREMHDPAGLATRDRAYAYDHEISPDRAIVLDRTKDLGKRKSVPFRVAEVFTDKSWKRILRFKPNDLSLADKVEFDINGTPITDRLVGDFVFEMSDPPNSARYRLDLVDSPIRHGDNEFGATLLKANPDLQEWTPDYLGYEETLPVSPIRVTELEILVTRS